MKRVAFILPAKQTDWLGGLSYIRNLLSAILSNSDRRVEPVLLAHPTLADGFLAGFPPLEIVRTSLVDRRHPARLMGEVALSVMNQDLILERLLRKHRIDILSHSQTAGTRSALVSIGWIPDFQHVQMPQFFSKHERDKRDRAYRRLIVDSRRVILSSEVALSDFASFAPNAVRKACVLHFVSCFADVGPVLTPEEVHRRFGVDRPFFHLPNQFWAHKNHSVVVEALGILKKRGINALVLATGSTSDYRNQGHFERLMARTKELQIENNFRALAVVTLPELRSLMLNALALINPSNFEGWSTTVEEAKSLGLPIILSDIPVHIEQSPSLGRYFSANSAEDLAEAMLAAMRGHDPDAAAQSREAATRILPARMRQFGKEYEQIVSDAIADGGPRERN